MSSTVGRRLAALASVAAVLMVLLSGCNRTKVEGEGRVEPSGRILLTRDDRAATIDGARSLVTGDKVEVADGAATVTLPGGDVLELRPRTVVILADGPEVRSGSVLVLAAGAPRTMRAAGSQVDAVGATRIDVSLALRVVSYGGRAAIRSGGSTLEVPALREASVPVIGVLRGPRPLAIDRADPWDQRFLGEAATLEPDLESRARGFTGQVAAGNASSVAYYRDLLPGLGGEPGFQQADVERLGRGPADIAGQADVGRFRAGDVLFGAAVAVQGRRGTFADRLAGATAFRAEGASWSLVSLDQQVPSIEALLRLVDGAVNVAPLELASPGARPSTPSNPEPSPDRSDPTPTPVTPRPPAPRTTPTTRAAAPVPTAPPSVPQPAPLPARPTIVLPLDPLLDAAVDPVLDLLNNLLGSNPR